MNPRLLLSILLCSLPGLLLGASHDDRPAPQRAPAEQRVEAKAKAKPDEEVPPLIDPLPWDHDKHGAILDELELTCVACHPVGLEGSAGPVPEDDLVPPVTFCHGCHRGEAGVEIADAPETCALCHVPGEATKPASHSPSWVEDHGQAARAARFVRGDCDDCHDSGQCVTCHEARGAMTHSPHGPGWRSFHGIDARLDLAGCVQCHAEETCEQCHLGGTTPW